ncbi:hypothetical protein CJ739_303 [Mariniflexile rhizosphaerae]|nr:hypothetical protein CJ739_303 [Mariniflexile sp. TRM1-10]
MSSFFKIIVYLLDSSAEIYLRSLTPKRQTALRRTYLLLFVYLLFST